MKVLLFNGSPRKNGCTYTALCEIADTLQQNGIEAEILQIGSTPHRGCIGCGGCSNGKGCVFGKEDGLNEILEKCLTADGFIFGTPVYYASPNGTMLAFMDRLFYAAGGRFAHKPGAVIASARRAGTTASLDAMTKYLTISQMPVVSSTYWAMVHGSCAEDVKKDEEGLQTMRNLGQNMAWLLRCIEAGKSVGVKPPQADKSHRTNFIR